MLLTTMARDILLTNYRSFILFFMILYELPIQQTPEPRRPLPAAWTQPVTDRYAFEMPTRRIRDWAGNCQVPGHSRFAYELPPQTRTQPVLDRLRDNLPDMPNSVPGYHRLPPRAEIFDSIRSPENRPDEHGGTPAARG